MSVGQTGCTALPRFLMACLALASASLAWAEGRLVPPVSVIQIPVELDLGPLFRAAESSLPTHAGNWPGWRKWHGIDVRYRAWRGPLRLSVQGDVLKAKAHVRYQLQARKGLIGDIGFSVGCGVDEPPRQALIGILARLNWGPDWSLHPGFKVLPTRFLDGCEVSMANFDVSPLVGREFEQRIETTLSEAMRVLGPRLARLRGEATRAWQRIQMPREVAPGLWLHVQPLSLALAPPLGAGSRLQSAVWLVLRARLSADPQPETAPTPLPPLVPYQPSQPGMRFGLALELDYASVSALINERLAGETLEAPRGKMARIDKVKLSAKDEDLVLEAALSGDLAGRLAVMARPAFDVTTQTLRLEDVGFVFDAADPDQELMANLFYGGIRSRIEEAANSLLAARTKALRDALTATFLEVVSPDHAPQLAELRIAQLRLRIGDRGLTVAGTAGGILKLGKSDAPGRL
jgi:hypothetical protein